MWIPCGGVEGVKYGVLDRYYTSHLIFKFAFFAARVAFGVEVILGAFCYETRRPLSELHVLDAGNNLLFSMALHRH